MIRETLTLRYLGVVLPDNIKMLFNSFGPGGLRH